MTRMDDDLSEDSWSPPQELPDIDLRGKPSPAMGTPPRDPVGDTDDGGASLPGAALLLLLLALRSIKKKIVPPNDVVNRDLTAPVRIIGLLCKGVYLGSLLGGFLGGLLWSLFWNLVWSGLGL